MATLHAIAYEPPNIPTQSEVRIPRGLALVFEKCLAKKAEDRYVSAKDLATDLSLLSQQHHGGRGAIEDLNAFPQAEARRLPRWMMIAVAMLVGLGLVSWVLFDRMASAPLEAETAPMIEPSALQVGLVPIAVPRVIVAYFENQTGDVSLEWISSGLPQMLTTDLSRSTDLEMIATQRLHDLLVNAGKDASMPLDRSTTSELARWARADIVISGSVFKLGEQYRVDVQAYDVETGTLAAAQKVSGVDLFTMVEELTAGLLLELTNRETRSPEMLRPTKSEEAFRAFTAGKTQYANLQYGEAAESFRVSMEYDGEFALPQIHLATSLLSMGEMDEGLIVIERVLEDSGNLPDDDRLLAQGIDAYFREGNLEKGTDLFNELIERYPRNTEARVWMARGVTELDGDSMEGIRQLRAALKVDRDYLPAVVGLADEMARLGAVDESQALLQGAADRCPLAAEAIEERMN